MFRWYLLVVPAAIACASPPPPLRAAGSIPLHVSGRIDHFAVDVKGQRLFVAALGNNTVEIISLKTNTVTGAIKGLRGPQGIAYLPEQNRLVVANRDDGTIRFYDADSLQQLQVLNKLSDADNVRYDAVSKNVVVGYGDGAIGLFTPDAKQLGEVLLESHPESFQLQRKGTHIFVNMPQAKNIAVVDRVRKAVVRLWPLESGSANFAMALDEANERVFVACRKPAKLLTLNMVSGLQVDERITAGDIDDIFYDAARKRLYAIGGEGKIDVVSQKDADHYEPLGTIPTAGGARTGLFVPELNRLYIAVPARGNQSAEIRIFEAVN